MIFQQIGCKIVERLSEPFQATQSVIRSFLATTIILMLGIVSTALAEEPPSGSRDFRNRQRPIEYRGPGRDEAIPTDLDEIRLGYFGPAVEDNSPQGDLWRAAQMAIAEENAAGGYRGTPFRLVSSWSESPWQAGVKRLIRSVYEDRLWAIVGGIDGPSTHLAEQVAAKARLVVVSPISTDKSANLAGVPWIFSCSSGDHLAALELSNAIEARMARGPLVVVESDRHDPHHFAVELLKQLSKRRIAVEHHQQFHASRKRAEMMPEIGGLDEMVTRTIRVRPGAIVIVAGSEVSGVVLRRLKEAGYDGPVFGSSTMARRAFLLAAGPVADGAIFPLVSIGATEEGSDRWHAFSTRYQRRYGVVPDGAVGKMFDSVRLLLEAVRKAELNRARIAGAMRNMSPWSGVAGPIAWDPVGSNATPVGLGTIEGGEVIRWQE